MGKGRLLYRDQIYEMTYLLDEIEDDAERQIAISMLQRQAKKNRISDYSDVERHLTYAIASGAYKYVLEDSMSAKQALIAAAKDNQADIEKVLEEKSRQSKRMNVRIIKQHAENPVQKDMKKERVFDTQAMKNSNNVWQMLKLLANFKHIYDSLKALEDSVAELKDQQHSMSVELAKAKADIEKLKQHTNMPTMTDKERARLLKGMGYTQKIIAEAVGKEERTIRRWWKDI